MHQDLVAGAYVMTYYEDNISIPHVKKLQISYSRYVGYLSIYTLSWLLRQQSRF